MSQTDPCFEHIIGISTTLCDCFDFTADDMISDSGLYMLDLEPLNAQWISGREDCEKGALAEICRKAREEGIKKFKNDLLKALLKYNTIRRIRYKGAIGKFAYDDERNISQTYAGMIVHCADVKGGMLKISGINTIFSETGTIDIIIYNNLNELVHSETIVCNADLLTPNTVSIELPMHSDYVNNLSYHILYSVNGKHPKDISLNCNEDYCFDIKQPCFTKYLKGWESWVMVSGETTDILNFIDCNCGETLSQYTNGLILDVELYCKLEETICKDAFDFTSNESAISVAYGIRFASDINLIDALLGDTGISRFQLMNKETLVNFRSLWSKEYQQLIEDLALHLDISLTDCYKCKDFQSITKSGIFS